MTKDLTVAIARAELLWQITQKAGYCKIPAAVCVCHDVSPSLKTRWKEDDISINSKIRTFEHQTRLTKAEKELFGKMLVYRKHKQWWVIIEVNVDRDGTKKYIHIPARTGSMQEAKYRGLILSRTFDMITSKQISIHDDTAH